VRLAVEGEGRGVGETTEERAKEMAESREDVEGEEDQEEEGEGAALKDGIEKDGKLDTGLVATVSLFTGDTEGEKSLSDASQNTNSPSLPSLHILA